MEYKIYFAKECWNENSPVYIGVALTEESFLEYLKETYPNLKNVHIWDEYPFVVGEVYKIYPF